MGGGGGGGGSFFNFFLFLGLKNINIIWKS